jgi:hypothetical protein
VRPFLVEKNITVIPALTTSRSEQLLPLPNSEEGPQGDTFRCHGGHRKKRKKLHGLNPRANYTDRATAACRRGECQLLCIEGATWSA